MKEKERCPNCGLQRYAYYQYCPKCGHKFKAIETKNHPATYKRCMDCKWFRYYTEEESSFYYSEGKCVNPNKVHHTIKRINGKRVKAEIEEDRWRVHTTKACKMFEEE